LFLYYDDFETNNPLGSAAGIYKVGALYCSIAILPSQYSSLLENIFLVQLKFIRSNIFWERKMFSTYNTGIKLFK